MTGDEHDQVSDATARDAMPCLTAQASKVLVKAATSSRLGEHMEKGQDSTDGQIDGWSDGRSLVPAQRQGPTLSPVVNSPV